ncbi:hypothetical protein FSZ17_02015 [Cytobacillus dafuensis]|uniref:Uncharacterized protein n=1 Tax=Cytobacillus dafuensis TaxID=1742359 RepID=A0A5B8Z1Q3_CYTDA|nr:hypothetical protein FSZ17_02015 [Cytobacillus dafuensis]
MAVLKLNVDNNAILLLIGAEGARLLREKRVKGRPRRSDSDEEASGPPAVAKCLQRKSTGEINIAFNLEGISGMSVTNF